MLEKLETMSNKLPTLRLSEVTKRLLEFGIKSRDGKGSELVFFGKTQNSKKMALMVVGRHKANREITGNHLLTILKRFEITDKEFLKDYQLH